MRRATKKPAVPWTCGSVCRNSGRRGWRNCGHSSARRRVDLEPGRVDDGLRLVGVDRADRVDDRPARPHALGRGAQQLELELGQRLGAPAQVRPPVQDAEPRARCVDERAVEADQLGRKRAAVGDDDAHVRRAEPPHGLLELARARLVDLDRRHLAREHRRLAAGRGAEVERRARPRVRRPRARRAATPRSAARSGPRRARPRRPGRRARRRGSSASGVPSISPRTSRTTGSAGLVLRAHERERLLRAEVAPPRLGDPVRVRVLQRGLARASPPGATSSSGRDPVGEPPQHGVRERDGPLEPGTRARARPTRSRRRSAATPSTKPSWYAPSRSAARTGGSRRCDAATAERLDRVVERPHALHGAEREPLRERAIALVEARRPPCEARDRRTRRPRRRAGGRRTPRARAGLTVAAREAMPRTSIRRPPSGWTSTRLERAVVADARAPDRDAAAVELGPRADVRRERAHDVDELARGSRRGRACRSVGRDLVRVRDARPSCSRKAGVGSASTSSSRSTATRGGRRVDLARIVVRRRRRTARCAAIGPASSSFTSLMIVTPVSASPAMSARSTGAAPRQRGSSDGWTLSQSRSASSASGTMQPVGDGDDRRRAEVEARARARSGCENRDARAAPRPPWRAAAASLRPAARRRVGSREHAA